MKTNLPNLPDNYRVEFEGTTIKCTYSLAFPKNIAKILPPNVLSYYDIVDTRKGYRCIITNNIINSNNIWDNYFVLKNKVMTQCRRAKIVALKTEIKQLTLF